MIQPFFRDTGIPNVLQTVSATAAGSLIGAVSGSKIVIYDILSSAACSLTDGTDTIVYVPIGSTNLTGGISIGAGKGLTLVTNSNITITYTVVS